MSKSDLRFGSRGGGGGGALGTLGNLIVGSILFYVLLKVIDVLYFNIPFV